MLSNLQQRGQSDGLNVSKTEHGTKTEWSNVGSDLLNKNLRNFPQAAGEGSVQAVCGALRTASIVLNKTRGL